MKRPLIALVFPILLILAANIVNAESWDFKKPSDDHFTDSQLIPEGKSVNLIKFTTPENTVKKDSAPSEISNPYMYLKLQWDTEKPISYTQLGKHYEERENWPVLQFFLLLQIIIP